uniref:TSA: Wollemia nobilis Ref_Wollemi_Transcript_19599_827 transcribed RNA sequence n=1 Tax=Wollemia nobilis TaxID=56998 RepID=A0A0C9S2G4_9CONI
MQGLQYRSAAAAACKRPMAGLDLAAPKSSGAVESPPDKIQRMTSENAVLVFSMTQCCMCHVVKRLLCGLGVNPTVCELDEEPDRAEMEKILGRLVGQKPPVPAVFIGGNLVGGLDRLMAMHIAGDLVPKLKQAGALWL